MALPPKLQKKYLSRFDELITEGEGIYATMKVLPGPIHGGLVNMQTAEQSFVRGPDEHWPDTRKFVEWRTKCISLIGPLLTGNPIHATTLELFSRLSDHRDDLERGIAILKGVKSDFENGFLSDLPAQVEAEIAADYLGQAEHLLKEGQSGKYDHVPAAVLTGAVLEKGLRTLCKMQSTPVSTTDTNGKPIMLNGMIDALKKAGAFNELVAKQLRAWADIRNKAAHGEFDQFKRDDVELMVKGISSFLAAHLK